VTLVFLRICLQYFVDQVQIGTHSFTFDHVYGNGGSPSSKMFEECVAPLVDGLFQGYNATVLAYGQVRSILHIMYSKLEKIIQIIFFI
jgi:hypothetical protein